MAQGIGSKKVLVLILAYNEENTIERVIESIRMEVPQFEIVVVNDGSIDRTERLARDRGVKVLTLPYNMGIGIAEQTGFKYAYKENFDIVIRVDADGQHNAKFIMKCLKPLLDNSADMVIGSRYLNNEGFQSTLIRRMGIKWICILIKLMTGSKVSDPTSGFRAINKKLIRLFSRFYPTDYPEPESLLIALKLGFKVKEVPVIMQERLGGKSSINIWNATYYMVKVPFALIIDESKLMRRKNLCLYD
jgi:glycosyltransferase involved in cell wall biosynthesis